MRMPIRILRETVELWPFRTFANFTVFLELSLNFKLNSLNCIVTSQRREDTSTSWCLRQSDTWVAWHLRRTTAHLLLLLLLLLFIWSATPIRGEWSTIPRGITGHEVVWCVWTPYIHVGQFCVYVSRYRNITVTITKRRESSWSFFCWNSATFSQIYTRSLYCVTKYGVCMRRHTTSRPMTNKITDRRNQVDGLSGHTKKTGKMTAIYSQMQTRDAAWVLSLGLTSQAVSTATPSPFIFIFLFRNDVVGYTQSQGCRKGL